MDANASYFVALGGAGGGGNAAADYLGTAVQAQSGTANTGSGGGGGCWNNTTAGGLGGSGVVIIRYPASFTIAGGSGLTFTTAIVTGHKVTTFTAGTGSISFALAPTSVEYLVIAGAGGGGEGGGGAGGYLTSSLSPALATSLTVTIGAGGSGSSNGAKEQVAVIKSGNLFSLSSVFISEVVKIRS
jgi:hypothetical protein